MLLAGNLGLTMLGAQLGLPAGVGYVGGCGVACALAILRVRTSLDSLLVETFQSQPFG